MSVLKLTNINWWPTNLTLRIFYTNLGFQSHEKFANEFIILGSLKFENRT